MIIGVDGNEANVREKVGVSVYTLKQLYYFQEHASPSLRFIVYLKNPPHNDLPDETEFFKYEVVRGSFMWSQIFLPLALLKNAFSHERIDVFFSPAHYAPRFCPCQTVVTIHDVAYLHYPDEFLKRDLYQLKNWTNYSIRKASKIITVSKTTKKDVMSFYKIPEKKIEVVYNGFEKEIDDTDVPKTMDEIDGKITPPYILYVGTIQPRKNIITLIRAFSLLQKTNPELTLVITGKKGWLFDQIFKEAKKEYLENKIIFTGYVTDEELVYLYRKAFCFALPSFYEGFGIPVLEAMSNGTPVVSSFSSSLPEVGGEAALYFDPADYRDLADKLKLLYGDKKLRNELVRKGRERIKQFSWDTCAASTLKILQDVPHEEP